MIINQIYKKLSDPKNNSNKEALHKMSVVGGTGEKLNARRNSTRK